jgi:hypothetical protein
MTAFRLYTDKFAIIWSIGIASDCPIQPRLIIRQDETGFGGSKGRRRQSQKVVVSGAFKGRTVYQAALESHFKSVIFAIAAAGEVLSPVFISKQGRDHPDAEKVLHFSSVEGYASDKAFIMCRILEHCPRVSLAPELCAETRPELGNETGRGPLLFDRHKAHISEVIRALVAQCGNTLFALPPHSSHVLRPLD